MSTSNWAQKQGCPDPVPVSVKPQFAGMSILERMWEELDDIMDLLMEKGEPEEFTNRKVWYPEALKVVRDWGELRGQAQGVAYCIALVQNPYEVDVPAVKKEAKRRWQERE